MATMPRSEKLDLRLTPIAKRMLYAAAAAARRSVSEFVLDSALARAEETLADRRLFGLDAERWEAFMAALDASAASATTLGAAIRHTECLRGQRHPAMTAFGIEKLARHHGVEEFDCGQDALNRFLTRFALASQQANAAQTYVGLADATVVGFYTLVVSEVAYADAPERLTKGLARHPVPLMLLARLAVGTAWKGKALAPVYSRTPCAGRCGWRASSASARWPLMRRTTPLAPSTSISVSSRRLPIRCMCSS